MSWLPGWLFAAVTQAPALLVVAWLLPGVGMLLAGRLLSAPMLIIFVPLAIALCYFAMRRLPVAWPGFGPGADTLGSGVRPALAAPDAAAGPADPADAPSGARRRRPEVPLWSVVTTIAIAAGFAVWQALERSQQLIVARAPGEYLQYAYWIAHHGTARIPVPLSSFGLSGTGPAGLQFASPGFLVHGAVLSPAFMAGLPLVLAAGIWAHGVSGALLVTPILGGCAVLSVAGLAGRLVGARWAPAAALVLAVTQPEQYVSRTTLSEPLVQVLLFGGLCLVLDSLAVGLGSAGPAPGPAGLRPEADAGPAGPTAGGPGPGAGRSRPGTGGSELPWQAMTLAGLGGLAIGLTVVADIGSLVILLPAFPFLAFLFVARRPQAAPMAVGLVAGIGYSVLSGSRLARAYLSALGPQLHDVGLAAAGFGVATALIAPLALPVVRAWAKRVVQWRMPIMGLSGKTLRVPVVSALLEGLTVLVPVAVLVGFAIRPSVQVTRGATDPYAIRFVASLQRLAGLAVDGRQQYYEQSLNWVIWYVGLPAVLLACLGAALLGRRCLRALLRWRGAAPAAQFWALPLLVFGWSTVAVLWDPATFPDQPWASRRLVPVVLPGLICLALWVCSRVRLRAAELDAGQVSVALVAACALLALAIPAAVTTFDPGFVGTSATATSVSSAPSSSPSAAASASPGSSSSFAGTLVTGGSQAAKHLAVRGMALKATYTGEQRAVATLCSAISPSASVIIVDSATVAFTQVVRGMCGIPTARMDGAPASAVQQVITDIERAGRRPVLLGSTSGSVALGGAASRQIVNLKTTQDAEALTGPPATPWPVTYTVWMASPAAT